MKHKVVLKLHGSVQQEVVHDACAAAAARTCLPPAQDALMRDSVISASEEGTYLCSYVKIKRQKPTRATHGGLNMRRSTDAGRRHASKSLRIRQDPALAATRFASSVRWVAASACGLMS
jgi:hypothetical protein